MPVVGRKRAQPISGCCTIPQISEDLALQVALPICSQGLYFKLLSCMYVQLCKKNHLQVEKGKGATRSVLVCNGTENLLV